MAWPLQDSDPRQLGVYRLVERARVESAGVVYLGRGPDGDDVSVALLSARAAADPLARETFVAAVRDGSGVENAPEVLASRLSGPPTVWVACDGAGSPDAAVVFLRALPSETGRAASTKGPVYRPHWDRGPAVGVLSGAWASWAGPWRGRAGTAQMDRRVLALLLLLLALIVAIIVLLVSLYPLLVDVREEAASTTEESEPTPTPSPEEEPSSDPDPSGESESQPESIPEVEVDPEELEEFQGEEGTSDPTDMG
ncbi:hypothetical protein J4H86_03595 [Spiractinospora alimapuensis]|uniref:hypothetical protein n=1 Tax=Spiractinospora alimapuensis TaxID=2820884 RepID=UPI001F2A6CEC|nr:hypothetical protein [Spiractinospora alimapuensis]QVQ52915.1 hypothetical protein J4H86_03595 [Spiractinospora alimapuensis]